MNANERKSRLGRSPIAAGVSLALAISLIAGCASPITSYRDTVGSGAIKGFTYHLTRSKIALDVSLRLESCNPLIATFQPVKPSVEPVADPEYVFRIDPAASYNLLKSISATEVSLTADRRLGSAKAKSEDASVALLTQLAQTGTLISKRSLFAAAAPWNNAIDGQKAAPNCLPEMEKLVTLRSDLRASRYVLVNNELEFIKKGTPFKKGDEAVLKAFSDARAAIEGQLAKVNDILTKTVRINLTPSALDSGKSVVVGFDLNAGWRVVEREREECAAPLKQKKDAKGMPIFDTVGKPEMESATSFNDLATPPGPEGCLYLMAELKRKELPAKAGEEIFEETNQGEYPGLLYRIPSLRPWALQARDTDFGKFSIRIESALDDSASKFEISALRINDQKDIPVGEGFVRVAQWGRIGALRSDLSPIGTSGIDLEFDEWSIPKKVGWSAQAGGVVGLLGLGNQIEAARQKPDTPIDPSVALKSELLVKLLTECVNANPSALPTYCSTITK